MPNLPKSIATWIDYFPQFLPTLEADELQHFLQTKVDWQAKSIRLFGKTVMQPRLMAFFSDPMVDYTYSQLTWKHKAYPPPLKDLKDKVEAKTACSFNSVLLNYYRHGQDSMGWHADNEKELGPDPIVAAVTLGKERPFRIKMREKPAQKGELVLEHGSLLLMKTGFQQHFLHSLPKSKRIEAPRFNMTFRKILK